MTSRTKTIAKTTFLEVLLSEKLETVAGEIVDALLPKYKAEAEAMLEKAANRIIKQVMQGLVIEDKGSSLSVTISKEENPPNV